MLDTEKPGSLSALLRNPAVALPVAAAVGGLLVFLVIEGPGHLPGVFRGYQAGNAGVDRTISEATTAAATATYADDVAKAERDSRVAQARYAEEVVKAERDQKVAEAIYAAKLAKANAENADAIAAFARKKAEADAEKSKADMCVSWTDYWRRFNTPRSAPGCPNPSGG